MPADHNIVDAEWRRCLKDVFNNNMLMNSPLGKTAFTHGLAFAVNHLTAHWKKRELKRLQADTEEFERLLHEDTQMKYRLAAAAMTLAAALTTTPATAQISQAPIGVYDANNKFVGRLLYPGVALLQYGPNRFFAVSFDRDGLDDDDPGFYQTSSDCTGPKLLINSPNLPKWAFFEASTTTFWVQSNFDKTVVDVHSQIYEGHCYTYQPRFQLPASPALAIDTKVNFKGPFTLR